MKKILRLLLSGTGIVLSLSASGQINTVVDDTILPTPITCTGGAFDFYFEANDTRANDGTYALYIFKSNYQPVNGVSLNQSLQRVFDVGTYVSSPAAGKNRRKATVKFDPIALIGGDYKIYIFAGTAGATAKASDPFGLNAAPSVVIGGVNTTPLFGEPARIRFSFTGSGPWSFYYSENPYSYPTRFLSTTNTSVEVDINSDYYTSYTYDNIHIRNVQGGCGGNATSVGTVIGSAVINVRYLSITYGSISQPNTCPGTSITVPFSVNGAPPPGTKYRLEFSDANGSFSNPYVVATVTGTGSPLSGNTPPDYAPGTGYKLRIVPDNNNINTSIEVNVTLTRPAPPVAQTSYAYCPGENPTQLTASGEALRWYNDTGQLPGAPTPPKDVASSYNVTQTKDGCQSNFTTIRISIKPKSDRPNPGNRDYCQNEQANTLSELVSGVTNPKWYDSNGSELGGNFRPNTGEVGTKTYRVSQQHNDCRSDQAEFNIRVKPRPVAPGVKSAEPVCQLTSVSNALLQAAVTSSNVTLRWYETEQGGGGSDQPPTPRTGNAGLQTYFVSQLLEGCEGPRAKIEQEVKPAPALPTVASNPVLRCLNDPVTTLAPAGAQFNWYRQASGGSREASISVATNQVRTDSYYVSQTGSNGCESGRQAVEVRVLAPPASPEVTAAGFACQFSKPVALQPSGSGLVWSGTGITGSTETAPVPSTALPATFSYQIVQRVGTCTSAAASLTYTIRPVPAAPTVQSPLKLCLNSPIRDLTAPGQNLKWYDNSNRSNPAQNRVTINPTTAGTMRYYVTETDNFGCESQTSLLEVQVLVPVSARLTGDSLVMLYDSSAIRVQFTGEAPFTMTLWDGRIVTTSSNPYVVWVKPKASGTYQLRALSNDCGSGNPGNAYVLRVLIPLSTEPTTATGAMSLRIFPNPSNTHVNLTWEAPAREVVRLRLIDVSGRTLWQRERSGTGIVETEQFSLRDLSTGLYLIQLLDEQKGVVTKRILKN